MRLSVGIDARPLGVSGGSQRYTGKLASIFSADEEIRLRQFAPGRSLRNRVPEALLRPVWENVSLPLRIESSGVDLFHGPKNVVPIATTVPTVVTVHDLIPLRSDVDSSLDQRIYYRLWGKYVESADHVIAISRSTKSDVLAHLSVSEDDVTVVYHGVDARYEPLDAGTVSRLRDDFGVGPSEDVLLNVGTIKPNKNYCRLVEAFETLRDRGIDCSLLIAGRPGRDSERVLRRIANSNWSESIRVLGFVSDDELRNLYNLADVFVHPSLYEGFGLPPLEAMACGTPVVASNTSSVPEIVGTAGLLVDPRDATELADATERVLTDDDTNERLRRAGLARAEEYSWEKTARETINVYRSVIAEHS